MILTIWAAIYISVSAAFFLPFGVLALIPSLLGFRKLMASFIYRIEWLWGSSILKAIGCKVTVTGKENIPKKGGVCFVSNHSSYFDIVLLAAYTGRPAGFVAKKELLWVPILNFWIYMIGGLFIDRSSVRKAMRTIGKGVERIKNGGGMIIFPEGTRSKGRTLLPFRLGALKLATSAEAPIIPVAIDGSYRMFEEKGRIAGASVKIAFCPPIYTAELPQSDRKQVLSDRIYSVIKEQMDKFTQEETA